MFVLHDAKEVSQVSKSNGNGSPKAATSGYDLTLVISETENGLKGKVQYCTDIFEVATIQRLCGHYETLLKAIARDPEESIAKLPMLTERERTQLLYEWNDTRTECPQVCVHELFEQQASLHPDSIALVFEDRQLTYRELNERAEPGRKLSSKARRWTRGAGRRVFGALPGDADRAFWASGRQAAPTYPRSRLPDGSAVVHGEGRSGKKFC